MKKDINQIEKVGKRIPFKVPEGYFEGLTDHIMVQLPPKVDTEVKVLSVWERFKPWAYMVAMFVGIALMVKVFVGSPVDSASQMGLVSDADLEEYYQYYEDQLTSSIYHESLYLGHMDDFDSFE